MLALLPLYLVVGVFDTAMFIGSNLYKALKLGAWVTRTFIISYYGVGGLTLLLFSRVLENKMVAAWLGFLVGSQTISLAMWRKAQTEDLSNLARALHK